MKKIIIVFMFAAATLVGCSTNTPPTATITVTERPTPSFSQQQDISDEELYLLALKSMNNPILNVATDEELLQMGYSVCDALNAGFTTDDVIQYMAGEMATSGMTSDVEVEAVGYIIGAADSALCPGSTF